jgi:Lar family restriction alleviation protein
MAELKKCPFCGGEAETRKEMGGTTWRVKCTRCSAEVGRYWFGSRKQAVIAWNYRVNEAEQLKEK